MLLLLLLLLSSTALCWDLLAYAVAAPPYKDLSLCFLELRLLFMTRSERMDYLSKSPLLLEARLPRLTWPAEPELAPAVSIVFASSRALTLAKSLNWLVFAEEAAACLFD